MLNMMETGKQELHYILNKALKAPWERLHFIIPLVINPIRIQIRTFKKRAWDYENSVTSYSVCIDLSISL